MPPCSSSTTTTTTRTSTMPPSLKPTTPNSPSCPSQCRHSPSATLDLLIFILVLFSGTFLIISYFSYIFQSLSLLLPSFPTHFYSTPQSQLIFIILFFFFFLTFLVSFEICFGHRSRRCGKTDCRGLKKAMEFDLQIQGEDLFKQGSKAVRDVNNLPWKGGSEDNPDYDCLRAELRKMAPINGRAVLLFRAKCGCPHSKLEGWGTTKRAGRRNKKSLAMSGGGDHRR